MAEEHFLRFFPAVCAGFGLFLAGAANLLLLRRGFAARAAATVGAAGVALAAASAIDQPGATAGTARLLAYGLVPALALGCGRLVGGAAALVAAAHRPAVRYGLLAAAGVATVVGSVVVCERADEAATNAGFADLELAGRPDCVPSERVKATTDRGTRVVLKEPRDVGDHALLSEAEGRFLRNSPLGEQVIRRGAADDRSNCHGWVFTGGRFLLGGEDVPAILAENGYREEYDPRPGDVVVYRENGQVTHTALVRYVGDGQPVLVESKWGNLGVFLHPADQSPYGVGFTFHRSARPGHLLAGTGGPAPTASQHAVEVE